MIKFMLFWLLPFTWLSPDKDFSKQNLKFQYDLKSPIFCDHQVASNEDEIAIFLKITSANLSLSLDDLVIDYQLASSYRASKDTYELHLDLAASQVHTDGQSRTFRLVIPNVRKEAIALMKITADDESYFYDLTLRKGDTNFTSFLPWDVQEDMPKFDNFIGQQSEVVFRDVFGRKADLFGFYYDYKFDPALPPTSMTAPKVAKEMSVESVIKFENEGSLLDSEGLYFVQSDTNGISGLSLLVSNSSYPRYSTLNELIPPSLYLSTRSEYQNLLEAENTKVAFDRYWVKMSKDKRRAKKIIKEYYRSIAAANQLFSSYKEGWKTDRGMIYTILGTPDEVYRNDVGEVWVYQKSVFTSELVFNFERIPNIFDAQNYVLVRSKKYRADWNQKVKLWREGTRRL